jgi:GrpB protein
VSDPTDLAAYEKALAERTIGQLQPLTTPIEVPDYDPSWPHSYEREAARIRSILGGRVVRIEHVGSTSVRGLPAKPIIDIVLEVKDSADEAAYVPDMEAAGYVLRIREADWFQNRLFKAQTSTSTCTPSLRVAPRWIECFCSATGSVPMLQIGNSIRVRSGSWRHGIGSTCSSTRTPRRRWSRR